MKRRQSVLLRSLAHLLPLVWESTGNPAVLVDSAGSEGRGQHLAVSLEPSSLGVFSVINGRPLGVFEVSQSGAEEMLGLRARYGGVVYAQLGTSPDITRIQVCRSAGWSVTQAFAWPVDAGD